MRIGLLRGAFGLPRRALRLLKLERGARGRAARQQIRIGDAAGAGAIELGEQRAARIGRNGRDRSGARTDAEPMQGERSLGFGSGPCVNVLSTGRDATPEGASVRDRGVKIAASAPFAIMAAT